MANLTRLGFVFLAILLLGVASTAVALEDSDEDTVPDPGDACPNTPSGQVVNSSGCSIPQLCPCSAPTSGGRWKNHGEYVSCVTRAATTFSNAGIISRAEKGRATNEAAKSSCGKEGEENGNGAANRAPVLDPIGNQTIPLGQTLSLTVTASDPDGDSLRFEVSPLPLPGNAGFNQATGHFVFFPTAEQVGSYTLAFSVTDGLLADAETILLTVPAPEPGQTTALSGRILDANAFEWDGTEVPVVGATVSILGSGQSATSDANGNFTIPDLPAGSQVFDIDTGTANPAPDGSSYAGFREEIELIEGVTNVISRPFFLPLIDPASLTPVNPNATTVVTNPNLGITLAVPPHTAKDESGGDFAEELSISRVPRGLAPAALPEFMDPGLLITIQPVGVTFATPVPITFPNFDNLPPGAEVDLWSLDANEGVFTIVGVGQVTADGGQIETVSGGIVAADWHTALPPPPSGATRVEEKRGLVFDPRKACAGQAGSRVTLQNGCLEADFSLPSYRSLGISRSLRFVYQSERAHPRPLIPVDSSVPVGGPVPPVISYEISLGGTAQGNETFVDTSGLKGNVGESIRNAASWDASSVSSGAYAYRMRLTSHYAQSQVSAFLSDQILIVNGTESSFGAGWGLEGLSRLEIQPDGRILLTDGDGSAVLFRRAPLEQAIFLTGDPASGGMNIANSFVVADDFEVPGDSVLQGVRFWTFENPASPFNSDWDGSGRWFIFLDGTGSPASTPIASGDASAMTRTSLGSEAGGEVVEYEFKLDVPVALEAGVRYWLGLHLGGNALFWVETNPGPFGSLPVRDGPLFGQGTSGLVTGEFDWHTPGSKDRAFVLLGEGGGGSSLSDTTFVPPPGDFTRLEKNPDETFTRVFKDGTRVHFNAQGLQSSVVDRNGNETIFTYVVGGRLISITDPAGQVTTLSYTRGRLDAVTDPAGRTTTFTHDGAGDLTGVIFPDRSSRAFRYDRHLLTGEVNERGFLTTRVYDGFGRLKQITLPDGSTRSSTNAQSTGLVDPAGGQGSQTNPAPVVRPAEAVSTYTDGNGQVQTVKTDRFGAPTRITDALARTTTIDRNEHGDPERITRPNGATTRLDYDERGNLTLTEEVVGTPLFRSTTLEYEPRFNQITRIVDPEGAITTIDYDSSGNVNRISDLLGNTQNFDHNARGLLLTYMDENGQSTSFEYDAKGNLKSVADASGSITLYERDAAGNITRITEAAGSAAERTVTFTYDDQNRVLTFTDATGAVTSFRYDAQGNPTEVESPTGEVVRRFYDPSNRLVRIEDPATGITRLAYDGNGNLVRSEDALGAVTEFQYDATGRLVQSTDALGGIERFAYDSEGNLSSFEDARGAATTFEYDLLNRLTRKINPLAQVTVFSYDSRDNLLTQTDPKDQTIFYSYDALSRLTSITTPDNLIGFTYDPAGNLTAVTDNDSGLTLVYDELNRPVAVTTSNEGIQPVVTLTYAYDLRGNRTELRDSLGGTSRFAHDAADRLTQITTPAGTVLDFSYDLAGRVGEIFFPDGITTDFQYDPSGRLSRLTHGSSLGSLSDFTYSYNAVGNIASIGEIDGTRRFTYDALQRLISGGTDAAPETYEYDPLGNRLRSFLSENHDHDLANRLLEDDSFQYSYDANGNLESKTSKVTGEFTHFSYDALNQLVRIDRPDGAILAYRYDGLGRRIEKSAGGAITRYFYDGDDILLEFDGENNLLARYSHGNQVDQPLLQERFGQTFFYHSDHLGSIRHITNAAGNVVNTYAYDSYGRLQLFIETIPNPFTYTAREFDPESGLYYYRARYYDPATGRFLTEDPIHRAATDPNLYQYVRSNPVNFADPFGKEPLLLAAAIGAVSGAAIETGSQLISNDFNFNCLNFENIGIAALQGAILGGVGGKIFGLFRTAMAKYRLAKISQARLFRFMREAELEAVRKTGQLRGGRPGRTYFTNQEIKSAARAQERLSLPRKPTVRVEFEIVNTPGVQGPRMVDPSFGHLGKGIEFFSSDTIRITITNVQKLKP